MPERNAEVQSKVREALESRPDTPIRELYEMAQSIDPDLGLDLRQFNGSYVLPLKRERSRSGESQPRPRKKRGGKKAGGGRGRKAAQAQEAESGSEAQPRRRSARARQEAAGAQGGGKEEVRSVLLEFARDLSAAETALEIIDVMGKLDGYAERILEVTGRK
jgi:hypothetical protein